MHLGGEKIQKLVIFVQSPQSPTMNVDKTLHNHHQKTYVLPRNT